MTAVRDNAAEHRYEIHDGRTLAGLAAYTLTDTTIAFTHTEVDAAFSGRGLARQLVTEALDDVRGRGLSVLPFCPYVRKVIASEPEQFLDLVLPQDRERFNLPHGGGVAGPDARAVGETEAGR